MEFTKHDNARIVGVEARLTQFTIHLLPVDGLPYERQKIMSIRESSKLSPAELQRVRQDMKAGAFTGLVFALILVGVALYELWK